MAQDNRTQTVTWKEWAGLGCLLAAGLLLRLHGLGAQSFWMDEYIDYYTSQSDFISMLAGVRVHRGGLPLHYFIQYLMLKVGQSEVWLRLPAMLFSTAAIGVAFAWARVIYQRNRQVAWFFSLLMAVSLFQIRYAQEARFYALFVFLTLAMWWRFTCAMQTQKRVDWLIYLLVTLAASYTHYYTFITLMCHAGMVVFPFLTAASRTGKSALDLKYMTGVIGLTGLAFLPAAAVYLTKENYYSSFHWQWSWVASTLRLLAGGLSAWLVFLLLGNVLLTERKERAWSFWICASWLLGMGIVFGLDKWRGYFFHVRQLIFIQPLFLLLMAIGIATLIEKAVTLRQKQFPIHGKIVLAAGIAIILGINLPVLWAYKTATQLNLQQFVVENRNPDWHQAVDYLKKHTSKNTLFVCLDHIVKKGLDYQLRVQNDSPQAVAQVNYDIDLLKKMLSSGDYSEYWLVDGDVFDGYLSRLSAGDQAWIQETFELPIHFYQMHLYKYKNPQPAHDRKELLIDFKQPEARMFLGEGWWEADDPQAPPAPIWSEGRRSSVILPITKETPKGFVFRVQPLLPQTMHIVVNGKQVKQVEIHSGWAEYRVSVDTQVWQPGANRVEFQYSRSQRYHKFSRSRAVLWDFMRLEY